MFVANPAAATPIQDCLYARPDDLSDNGVTWRNRVLEYNANASTEDNPFGLLPAFELYANNT